MSRFSTIVALQSSSGLLSASRATLSAPISLQYGPNNAVTTIVQPLSRRERRIGGRTGQNSFHSKTSIARVAEDQTNGTEASNITIHEHAVPDSQPLAWDITRDTERLKPRHDTAHQHRYDFFDYNEQRFASITQLPSNFFRDIHQIRNLTLNQPPSTEHSRKEETHSTTGLGGINGVEESRFASQEPRETDESIELSTQSKLDVIPRLNTFQTGFWPSSSDTNVTGEAEEPGHDSSSARAQGVTISGKHGINSVNDSNDDSTDVSLFESLWSGASWKRRGKIDLSFSAPWLNEAEIKDDVHPTSAKQLKGAGLRGNRGARRLLTNFMQQAHQLLMSPSLKEDDATLDDVLGKIFTAEAVSSLKRQGYAVEDVLAWSWILLSPPAQGVRRFSTLSRWRKQNGLKPLPQFIVLQLLRSPHIDSSSLELLFNVTTQLAPKWDWEGTTPSLIVVRLLRHARKSAPDLLVPITLFNLQLFPPDTEGSLSHQNKARLTHWFNRLLVLLALPCNIHPFKSMLLQQESQFILLRHMAKYKPQIPVSREGYRALKRLQLMHRKTPAEADWARVKAPSWPPWQRRDQMGIDADQEYPGKLSRVMKVLYRMQETGYQLAEEEAAAKILAGWDTDSSPTIQVRSLSSSVSSPRPWLLEKSLHAKQIPTSVWKARIHATRSVREAWMCFCLYTEDVPAGHRSASVYHAMFTKLFAATIEDNALGTSLPGDGREVYQDPVLARDRVYIPEPIPSVKKLYVSMREAGLVADKRLLGDLLDHAQSISEGQNYIKESGLRSQTKEVLLNPQQCSNQQISSELQALPSYLLGSYFQLFCRRLIGKGPEWAGLYVPTYPSRGYEAGWRSVSPAEFSLAMLRLGDIRSTFVWNKFLFGIDQHIQNRTEGPTPWIGLVGAWQLMQKALKHMREKGILCDISTYRNIYYVAHQIQTWADPRAVQLEHSTLKSVQETFMEAVLGRQILSSEWIPLTLASHTERLLGEVTLYDLDWLIWHLGASQDEDTINNILRLLRWMHTNASHFKKLQQDRLRSSTLCIIRIVLEGLWADEPCQQSAVVVKSTASELHQARQLCEPFGWAADEDIDSYLQHRHTTINRLRLKVLSMSKHRAEDREESGWVPCSRSAG